MKRPRLFRRNTGRKRRVVGWTMVIVAVLVTGVWAASRWWDYQLYWQSWKVGVRGGMLNLFFYSNTTRKLSFFNHKIQPRTTFWMSWGHEIWSSGTYSQDGMCYGLVYFGNVTSPPPIIRVVWFAFWPVPLLLLAGGVPMLRSGLIARRRSRQGLCKACGYDRRGGGLAPETKCPECGK